MIQGPFKCFSFPYHPIHSFQNTYLLFLYFSFFGILEERIYRLLCVWSDRHNQKRIFHCKSEMLVFPPYSDRSFHVTKQHNTLNSSMNVWTLKTVIVEIIDVNLKCTYSIGRATPFLEKSRLNHSGKQELEVEPVSIQWPFGNTFEHSFSENSLSSVKTSCTQLSYKAFIVILLNHHSTVWDWMRQGILLSPSHREETRLRDRKDSSMVSGCSRRPVLFEVSPWAVHLSAQSSCVPVTQLCYSEVDQLPTCR